MSSDNSPDSSTPPPVASAPAERRAAAQVQRAAMQRTRVSKHLGEYLRDYREIVRRHSQDDAAAEIGVSRLTLMRMEQGHPGVKIGNWISAWQYMQQLDVFERLSHDEVRIADATAQLLQQRSADRRRRADAAESGEQP